jgi:hypothetical protein
MIFQESAVRESSGDRLSVYRQFLHFLVCCVVVSVWDEK